MKVCLSILDRKFIKLSSICIVVFFVLFSIPKSYAGYSHGPRQAGEAVLDEILMSSSKFAIRIGSGGCTAKESFKVDVKKKEGLSKIAPHYVLTIIRINPDECKAIFDDGVLILFDMEKDFGIKGEFTYSLTNPVYSSSRDQMWNESMWSIVEKHFPLTLPKTDK